MRTPASVWFEVRLAYLRGEGSLNELADRFSLGRKAVQSRCLREHWAQEKADAVKAVERAVAGVVQERAGSLAEHAGRFVERAVCEGNGWLDEIQQAKSLLAAGDVDGLLRLVRAWCLPVETLRKILDPAENRRELTIGVFCRPGDCVKIKSQVEGADPDAIDVS